MSSAPTASAEGSAPLTDEFPPNFEAKNELAAGILPHTEFVRHRLSLKSYNQWPTKPEGLLDACVEYSARVVHLANLSLGLITVSLGLPFNLFHHCFNKENTIRARLNYYPQCALASMFYGVNRYDSLTVLAQDDVGGLQVKRKDGQWVAVKPRHDAFEVNVGAIFQVWSNGKYCGLEHRVCGEREEGKVLCSFVL